jgi:hypothetical protein
MKVQDMVRHQPGAHVNAPAEPLPWADLDPRVPGHFVVRANEVQRARLKYAALHTAGESMQTFALKAIDEAVAKRLQELGKE